MNILDLIADILNTTARASWSDDKTPIKKGYLPPEPDTCIALFEYDAVPPEHSFGGTDYVHGVQVRSRALDAALAYTNALACEQALNRYHDRDLSIIQATPGLDIGHDSANPARQEYTVNFTVRRY